MRHRALLAALPALALVTMFAPSSWAAQCSPAQVKPVFTQPPNGATLRVSSSPGAVSFQGHVQKPAGCTTPSFTHVNLEILRKAPATSGQVLQSVGASGDVKLQSGQFTTTKQLAIGGYVVKGRLVQAGEAGNYWGATETISFTVERVTISPGGAQKVTPK